ncbi:MAG TPA: oligoendopeptidase F, partial [Anaerolineaceae bacterium]
MSQKNALTRAEIPEQYTWNAPSVFSNDQAWEDEIGSIQAALPQFEAHRGHLAESPSSLLAGLKAYESMLLRVGKVYVYANLSHNVDTANPTAARMSGQVMALFGQVSAAAAFIDPEMLEIGRPVLAQWMAQDSELKIYAQFVDDLFRRQEHVRSVEIEELLGMLNTPFGGAGQTATMITDADFRFAPAKNSQGGELPVTQGTLDEILAGHDREARRTAWEHYTDTYLSFKNTLASNLSTSINQNVFLARARHFSSTLAASLFQNNIPEEVFYNLVETFKRNLPTWHRYWAVRRKALGVDALHPYDIWAPLTTRRDHITFEQAVDWICDGLAPMGEDYVRVLRKGCLEDRWIDVFPNQGKSSSQFSSGWPGTHPFIFINFDETIFSVSTLAHELGHSMHSYLTWQNQPFVYSNYSLFAAEVASNFHQAMVRGHLLKNVGDAEFKISVIEEAMSNFHRYFFIMPTLARFELETHQRAERGEGLSAEDMNHLMADLFTEAYGGEMQVDRDRVGITWATFGHLYADYYVYQYTTGISGANALSRPILAGKPDAAQRYLGFLKSGSALYPLDALKLAGVDLSTPQPIEE